MQNLDISKTKWDLSRLFNGDDDPKIALDNTKCASEINAFVQKWEQRTDYLSDPLVLTEALREYETLLSECGNVPFYFGLRTALDQLDTHLKAKSNKHEEFYLKLTTSLQFFAIRLGKVSQDIQQKFLHDSCLQKYRHFLERLFEEAKYTLSEPEEKILLLKSQTSYSNWVQMTSAFLSKEEHELVTDEGSVEKASLSKIMSIAQNSPTKSVRDTAASKLEEIFRKHAPVAVEEINSILMDKKTDDDLRKYERPDQSRHIGTDIDTAIVDAMLSQVEARFDQSKRFYELKAKLLGVSKLDYHERNLLYGDLIAQYSFEKSAELVYEVFCSLDSEFGDIFKQFIKDGRFDVYPNQGKVSGAFCAGHSLTTPTYILLNHTNKLNDVLTIAHEMGHALNNEFMKRVQNELNYGSPVSTAEAASTFFEDFVLEKIYNESDDLTKLSILMAKLNDDISSIHRQVACYRFEQSLHNDFREKGYLAQEYIGELFNKNMSAYMGDFVLQNFGAENWWVYWSHIRSYFYVYSYASGLLISKSLQGFVKKDPPFILKIKEFLSAGISDSPKNIFLKLGLEITDKNFWSNGLTEVDLLLDATEALAKKLGKL